MKSYIHLRKTKPAFCALLVLGATVLANQLRGQAITITSPADGAVISELTSINGTVSGAGSNPYVLLAISKHETDLEWAESGGSFRWVNGPTGKWLGTLISEGRRWSAPVPAWSLPAGRDLPNGKYVITAKTRGGRQFKSYFTVRRSLPRPGAGDFVPTPARSVSPPPRPR